MKRAIVKPASGSLAARFAFLDLLVAIGDRVYPYSQHGPRDGDTSAGQGDQHALDLRA